MKVLVATASKHGATAGIADAIGDRLGTRGLDVTITGCEAVTDVTGFDAVVVGSAVYAGHWLDAAKAMVTGHGAALRARPVWLFSSGPIGDPPKPDEDPVDVAAMVDACGARDHQVFAGKLDRGVLRFAEKAVVVALRAPEGDFRDWDQIGAWADSIADALASAGSTT